MQIRFITVLSLCFMLPLTVMAKPRVMISNLRAQGVPEPLAQTLTDLLTYELSRPQKADIISDQDFTAALDHQAKQNMLGCDDDCMIDMARQLKCSHIVHGSVGQLGKQMVLNLTVLNIEDASVVGRQSQVLHGKGQDWLPAIQLTASQLLALLTEPDPAEDMLSQELVNSLNDLRTAQRPKNWNLTLSTGIGYFFSGLESAGLTQPLFTAQLGYDYSIEDWFLLGLDATFMLNQGSVDADGDGSEEVDVLLRGYYASVRSTFRKTTGLWMPYGGMSLGIGYIKISDDKDGSGSNTSVLGGPRAGRGSAGFLVRGYTGSQFMVSDQILVDLQLMIFQHINIQQFEVVNEANPTQALYQGAWQKIRGAIFMVGVAWQN